MAREQETRQQLEEAVSAIAQWANAGHILIPLPVVAQQLGMARQALNIVIVPISTGPPFTDKGFK